MGESLELPRVGEIWENKEDGIWTKVLVTNLIYDNDEGGYYISVRERLCVDQGKGYLLDTFMGNFRFVEISRESTRTVGPYGCNYEND